MADKEFKTYVPAVTDMKEFTLKAVLVGAIFSIVLGSANAYLGLKAGMTVAATFPAAVMAMAVLRVFKGTILEENICRTTAAVGEALVAGAIFTIPAFLIAQDPATGEKIWTSIKWSQSTALMLVGGVLGVLFVVFLRRILLEDKTLPFPESLACSEIVKANAILRLRDARLWREPPQEAVQRWTVFPVQLAAQPPKGVLYGGDV